MKAFILTKNGYVAARYVQRIYLYSQGREWGLWAQIEGLDSRVVVDGVSSWFSQEEAERALASLVERLGGVA